MIKSMQQMVQYMPPEMQQVFGMVQQVLGQMGHLKEVESTKDGYGKTAEQGTHAAAASIQQANAIKPPPLPPMPGAKA